MLAVKRQVVAELVDEKSSEELILQAGNPEEASEAHFYVGYQAVIARDLPTAIASFRKTIAAGVFGFFEHAGAVSELQKLERLEE